MATTDDEVTDRHDESDRTQFGNDTNLDGTHFKATHCHNCGTYVVKAPEAPDAYCIDCRRTLADIDWQSGDNIGNHHPTHPSTTPSGGYQHTITARTPPKHSCPIHGTNPLESCTLCRKTLEYQWGCLYCRETGHADTPTHATALHKIHIGYACPGAPGLNNTEIRTRLARRKTREKLYPHDVPPFTPTWTQNT